MPPCVYSTCAPPEPNTDLLDGLWQQQIKCLLSENIIDYHNNYTYKYPCIFVDV